MYGVCNGAQFGPKRKGTSEQLQFYAVKVEGPTSNMYAQILLGTNTLT